MKYNLIITVVLAAILIIGMIAFFKSMYFLIKCFQNIKVGREVLVKLNPFSLFMASNFTNVGNEYREKFIKNIGIGLLSVVISFIIGMMSEFMNL